MRVLPLFFPFCLFLLPLPVLGAGKFQGASSPLAAPLVGQWMDDFQKLQPGLRPSLSVLSSGEALGLWKSRKALFAAVDRPLGAEEERELLARPPFQLPAAIAGAAIFYNVPGVPDGLKLSPGILSRIFSGEIRNWNDPLLAQMNQGLALPPMAIQVILRREAGGPQDLFPSFLFRWDPGRSAGPGRTVAGQQEAWRLLREWAGGICAVDPFFAQAKGLPTAAILNEAGRYIQPSPASLAAAASDLARLPDNFQVSLSSSSAPGAYPLSSFTWLMVYQDPDKAYRSKGRGKGLVEFVQFALTQGQGSAAALGFAPLPEALRRQVLERASGIRR